MNQLDSKIAVVTGGNSGIGFATAKRFVDEGATVVITGRRPDAVEAAAEKLGPKAIGLVADAGKIADLDGLLATIKEKFGRIDILFLNAGVAPLGPIDSVTEESFDKLFSINVKGPYFTIQKALPLMSDGASIILNSSIAGSAGMAGASAYSASKAAVRSIGRTLAAELASRRIRINTLSPGPIDTPIYGKVGMEQKQVEELGQKITEGVPLGRFGSAEEMANVVLFLGSEQSSYLTGAEIQADGGLTQVFTA